MAFWNTTAKQLEKIDSSILKEAEAVAAELKAEMSKEAKELQLEQVAWKDVQIIISELKQVLNHLRHAEKGGPAGKKNLESAETLIASLATKLTDAERRIKAAISLDVAEKKIAKNAAKQLYDIHSKVSKIAATIRSKKGW